MPAKASWRQSLGALLLGLVASSLAQRSTVFSDDAATTTQYPAAGATETLYSFPGTSLAFDPVVTAVPGHAWDVPSQYLEIPGIYEAALRVSQVFSTYEPRLSTFCSLRKLSEFSVAQAATAFWDSNHQQDPCCGNCYVAGQAAELMYWPTPAIGNATALVDDSGYTFHSPSPYVAFQTLWAENRCSKFGPVVTTTTLAVNPTGISRWWVEPTNIVTADAFVRSELLDFRQFQGCTQTPGGKPPETITKDDGGVMVVWVADGCNPIIKIPVEVTNALPEWQTCGVWYSGIYDPPVVLTSGPNLHAPTAPPTPDPTPDPTTSKPVAEPVHDPTQSTSTPPSPPPTSNPTSTPLPPADETDSRPHNTPPSKSNTKNRNTESLDQQPSSKLGNGDDNPPSPRPTDRSSFGGNTIQTSGFEVGGNKVTLIPAPPSPTTQRGTSSNDQNKPGAAQVLPVGSITLTAGGPAATISGTAVSLGESVLVIGTQTYELGSLPTPVHPSLGIGDLILSAMGIDGNAYRFEASGTRTGEVIASYFAGENGSRPTGVDVVPFSGEAASNGIDFRIWSLCMMITATVGWLL